MNGAWGGGGAARGLATSGIIVEGANKRGGVGARRGEVGTVFFKCLAQKGEGYRVGEKKTQKGEPNGLDSYFGGGDKVTRLDCDGGL